MELDCIGDGGKAVDWWFMYKLPDNVKPTKLADRSAQTFKKTEGTEYLYLDAGTDGPLALSSNLVDQPGCALTETLEQLYKAANGNDTSVGWICYNDEIPGEAKNDGDKGHSKGVLAFDLKTDTAFWLLHSWPKFPDIRDGEEGAANYGQTYLCVALPNVDAARTIAQQMYNCQEPQTYETRLPMALSKDDILVRLANSVDVNETDPPGDIPFSSKAGGYFRLMAKNRHWDKDFWIDLVGARLNVNIDVETWRRGTVPGTEDSTKRNTTKDILYLNVEHLGAPYEWHYTKDHSKWAVSETDHWVCVADINRQTSQEKRGGGTICFRHKTLWQGLRDIEKFQKQDVA